MIYCKYRLSTAALLLALVSGCSVAPYQPAQAPVEERTPAPTQPVQQPAAESMPAPESAASEIMSTPVPAPQPRLTQSPAVIALLDDAATYQQRGDYRSAQNSLQRAQRIAPRDPQVYYSLAQTHLALEDYDLAEQVALKGVSLAQGNNSQLKRFWSLIASIRLRAGDAEGARQAEIRADRY